MSESNELSVPGFRVGGKRGKRYGVAVVVADEPAACSVMATSNRVRAAPVEVSLEHARDNAARAVVISSGNANAFTGEQGLRDANRMCELLSKCLDLDEKEVIVNSTGIIGQPLVMDEIEGLIREVSMSLRDEDSGIRDAADAMRTTDAFQKIASRRFEAGGQEIRVTGIAKGAGMVAPRLAHATMIAIIMTNAAVPRETVDRVLREAVENYFNMIVVDGDTSTNDMVVLLAKESGENTTVPDGFQEALNGVCLDLARLIVKDGEGATKLFSIEITGACSEEDAKRAARAVAGSTLVKTALFGKNPNWGRVIAAIGYSGADFDKGGLSLKIRDESQEAVLVKDGTGVALKGTEEVKRAGEILKSDEVIFTADLGVGEHEAVAFGCDLGYNYVKINAEYTS